VSIPSRTLLQIVQAVADKLAIRESGTATGGTTGTLVANAYPFYTARTDANTVQYANAEIRPTSGTEAGNARDISAWAPTTGTFTVGKAWATGPANNDTFDIYLRGVRYDQIKAATNRALRERKYVTMTPLTLVPDGDMESSGVTSWGTASNTTATKVSTAGNLYRGTYSLFCNNSDVNGYLPSAEIPVTEGDQYNIEAVCKQTIGTAKLIVYDATNSAEIENEGTEDEGLEWVKIAYTFNVPSGCKKIVVRLLGEEANADIYWDNVILLRSGATEIALPDWITEPSQVLGVKRQTVGYERADMDTFVDVRWYNVVADMSNPLNMYRLHVSPRTYEAMWLVASKPYSELATDSATTTMQREWLELAALVNLLEDLKNRAPNREQQQWEKEYERKRRVLAAWDARRMPPPAFRWGFASPTAM
jgi:hypothetical protein